MTNENPQTDLTEEEPRKVNPRTLEHNKRTFTPEERWDSWGDTPNRGVRKVRKRTLEEIERNLQ